MIFDPKIGLYSKSKELNAIKNKLKSLPSVISASDLDDFVNSLKRSKKNKKSFIVNIGECSESFDEFSFDYINNYKKLFGDIKKQLTNLDVLPIARLAGQFAKPRTSNYEIVNNQEMLSYFGDMINKVAPDSKSREIDPARLIEAYSQSVISYHIIKNSFFISHECLNLDYEENFLNKKNNNLYSGSAHFLWIGKRTNFLASDQIEFAKKIINPVGLKISADHDIEEISEIVDYISHNGKEVILIGRFGVDMAEQNLCKLIPLLIKYPNIHYISDPMHGNGYSDNLGIKRRNLSDIEAELSINFNVLNKHNINLDGVMLEATYDMVSECLGGEQGEGYTTSCDPRLNPLQTKFLLEKINSTF